MDRRTLIGLALIILVFVGFGLYNSAKLKKSYESAVSVADSLYEKGQYEAARLQYLKALEYKPGTPEAVDRIKEINRITQPDTITRQDTVKQQQDMIQRQISDTLTGSEEVQQPEQPEGAFSEAYSGTQEFIVITETEGTGVNPHPLFVEFIKACCPTDNITR